MASRAGIQRIIITDEVQGRGAWRFRESQARHKPAARLYRMAFGLNGMVLLPGYEVIQCTRDEFEAGYDYALGIDVMLNFESGMTAGMQEKFLYTKYRTVTVEYMQDPKTGEQGDWFNMRAQYYFVGYDRTDLVREWAQDWGIEGAARRLRISTDKAKEAFDGEPVFQDWIILNWPAVLEQTARNQIRWAERSNNKDGARASFRYAQFEAFPSCCVVAERDSLEGIATGRVQYAMAF